MGDQDRPRLIDETSGLVADVAQWLVDHDEVDWDELYGDWHPHNESVLLLDSAEGIDDLWQMEGAAERLIAAGRVVLAEIRRRMKADIDELGAVRLGTTLYRVKPDTSPVVIDGQEEKLLEWLGADLKYAVKASDVRITAVRGIAEKRGLTPTAIEQTFYHRDHGDDLELIRLPASRAPKYFATMDHGDRR